MQTNQSNTMAGLYLYAIVDAADPLGQITGIDDQPVRAVVGQSLAAVVSPVGACRLRPERRHLMAHQKVLASLGFDRGVLPLRFGVILPDEPKVRFILKTHETDLRRQLARVRGRVEMGLRVKWKEEDVFKNLLELNPVLRQTRDRMPNTREAAIEIGRQVAEALERERQRQQELLREVFGDGVVEFCFNGPKNDAQLLNAACLIPSDRSAEFESGVHRLGAMLDDRYLIDFNGPWAPHHFILLNMAMEGHC
ncbi:MAG: GvpL/GvpF family gas vesicle protein [Tepidisphaeraceae bacterium]